MANEPLKTWPQAEARRLAAYVLERTRTADEAMQGRNEIELTLHRLVNETFRVVKRNPDMSLDEVTRAVHRNMERFLL